MKLKKHVLAFYVILFLAVVNGVLISSSVDINWSGTYYGNSKNTATAMLGVGLSAVSIMIGIAYIFLKRAFKKHGASSARISIRSKAFLYLIPVALLLGINYYAFLYDYNDSWTRNATITACIERIGYNGVVNEATEIPANTVLEQPYIVIYTDGKYSSLDSSLLWEKPFANPSDDNIEHVRTFVLVTYVRRDTKSYTSSIGGRLPTSVSTYETRIHYFVSGGECFGMEIIEAKPLPKEMNALEDLKANKDVILRRIKTHFE